MALDKRAALMALATAGLLAGCMGSTEDRINAAVPVSRELEIAKANMDAAAKASGVDAAQLEGDYAAQMKIRALECSRGYEPKPWTSKEGIKQAVGNDACFQAADARILQWLGLRRIGWLATLPPLRPIPARPAGMLAPESGNFSTVAFAEKAGVAVMQSQGDYVVMDMEGKQIRKGESYQSPQLSLSPNGRLLLVGRNNEARIYDTESGEVLETLEDLKSPRVFWLGDRGLVLPGKEGSLVYRDFTTGEDSDVPMNTYGLIAVVPATGEGEGRYVLVGVNRLGIVEFGKDQASGKPTLVREEAFRGAGGWEGGTITPAHGQIVYSSGGSLSRMDLQTLSVESVESAPLNVMRVVPTPNPDQVYVQLYGGATGGQFLYSFSKKTMARVDTSRMTSSNLMYVPSVNRNAILDGTKVVLLDSLPLAGEVQDLEQMVHKVKFEQQLRQLEAMDLQQRLRGSQNSVYGATRPNPSAYPTSPYAPSSYPSRYPASTDSPAGKRSFSAGEAGLAEAIRAGVLRLGGPGDIDQWKSAYMTQNRRMPGRNFDDHLRMQKIYVITGAMTIPADLTGAHAVTFVLGRGVPFPSGSPGHSPILDMNSGQCSGVICGMYLRDE